MTEIVVLPNPDTLAIRAADDFVAAAWAAIAARGRFCVVLSGGSTPEKTYGLLAQAGYSERVDWSKVQIFFGDERMVPYDDSRSNYGMARRTLIGQTAIPDANIHPIPVDAAPDENARAYEEELKRLLGADIRFDLIHLGLGDDGHTASLFPGMPSLDIRDRLAVATPPGVLPPPVDRVTLTFPVLNSARQVTFLVAGAKKAQVLRDVIEGCFAVQDRPSVGVKPANGALTWLVDAEAASLLTP